MLFLFPHQKNDNSEAVFSCFLAPAGGPRPCKIKPKRFKGVQKRGYHLFRKSCTFYKKQPKIVSLWIPKDPQKLKKCWEKPSQNQPQTKHEKKGTRMKKKSSKVTQGTPTPLPPTPAEPPRRTPRAESQLKLWSLC